MMILLTMITLILIMRMIMINKGQQGRGPQQGAEAVLSGSREPKCSSILCYIML